MYTQLYDDLKQFDDATTWEEWSISNPELASDFWPLLLRLLQNPQVDDGKSMLLVKDAKANDLTPQKLRNLAVQYFPNR